FFQAEDGIRDRNVTGVQTCALPISTATALGISASSFEWHEGGAFVLMRFEIDEAEIPSAVAVVGSDDAAGTFTMIYFDERGISRRYTVEVAADEVRWHPDEAGFAQRMVVTIAPDGNRLNAQGTMSHDGGPWENDLQLTYERIDS